MKRTTAWVMALLLAPNLAALGENNRDSGGARAGGGGRSAPAARQPVVINMSRPSSGGHNRNFPSQVSQPAARVQPSYGRLQWSAPASQSKAQAYIPAGRNLFTPANRPNPAAYATSGQRAAVATHHHPYTPGYVRKKLQKIGVSQEPALITDRAQMINTSRQNSTIRFPAKGPDHNPLSAVAISRDHFSDPLVSGHMALVDSPEWHDRVAAFDASENRPGHYYWHADNGFNYCHYLDNWGYHWWGWYVGGQFFWNRYFEGRWWWYDSDFDRWCFWNDGFWWWQDPYHVADLYCYDDGNYIPCNSADDQVVVTAENVPNMNVYASPDGTRQVKVVPGTEDAFLYDTANPPSFQPVYLASGVESVSFSDPNSGRPLEIVLKLNDGSFDMFDANGNSYSPGNYDEDEAAQAGQDGGTPGAPPAGSNPPDGTAAPPAPDNSSGT